MEHTCYYRKWDLWSVTAARHIRKNSDKEITIISAETEEFFSRTALMYVYMGHHEI